MALRELLPGIPLMIVACASISRQVPNHPERAPSLLPGVTLAFERFGQATDPWNVRMAEPSLVHESTGPGNDVWIKISNASDHVIEFPTDSIYLRPLTEWDQMPDGSKRLPLRDRSEISVGFGVEDSRGRGVPHGSDFHWTSRLRPGNSAFFSVPIAVFAHHHSIYVSLNVEDPSTGQKCDEEFRAYFRYEDLPQEQQQ
jgi:hypothetical protein